MEIWRSVTGYTDIYEVSNHGNMRSLDRYVNYRNDGRLRKVKGQELKLKKEKDGHRIGLFDQGVQSFFWVHRLVALEFIPNPEGKECVFHKDFDVYNNHVGNLKWATWDEIREIAEYSCKLSRKTTSLNNHLSKPVIVDGVEYKSQSEAARKLNLNIGSVNHAVKKRYGYEKAGGKTIQAGGEECF